MHALDSDDIVLLAHQTLLDTSLVLGLAYTISTSMPHPQGYNIINWMEE